MQKEHNILHRLPQASVALLEHLDNPPLQVRPAVWSGAYRNDSWTLDYCGWEGMHCAVGQDGAIAPAAPRAPNAWHVYAPDVIYYERNDRPELRKEDMWLRFTLGEPWPPLAGRLFVVVTDPEGRLTAYIRSMCEMQQLGQPGSALVIDGLLLAVLGEIQTAAEAGGAGTPDDPWRVRSPQQLAAGQEERLLQRVDAIVRERLSSPPLLDELAEELNMSVSSLAHRFKAETGLTVVRRIRWLRIREARRLLLRPDANVKSVAYQLGFSSPAYFSKVFTEVAGIAPMSYQTAAR